MNKLEQARKTWAGKSDEWLYERLANELTSKVEEIYRLLKEFDEVNKLTLSDTITSIYNGFEIKVIESHTMQEGQAALIVNPKNIPFKRRE